MTFLEKQQGICLNQDARRSGTAEYIFLNKFFPPPCNIQNSDLHAGPAGSSTQGQHPLLATPWLANTPSRPYSFTLSSPGGVEAGGSRTPFLWYVPASIQPFLVWSSECLYSHPHIWAAPQPSSWDSPFKVKPSSCPALGTDQFVRNSYQVVRHEAGDHELWVCPERDRMSKPYALGHRGCPWKGCPMSDSVQPRGLHSPWNSPGQNTGVGCHALLQGIFPTQGSNPGLSHCRWILLPAEPTGKPSFAPRETESVKRGPQLLYQGSG